MKIVRKQYLEDEVIKTIITEKAEWKDWQKLIETARNKCQWSKIGIPYMTVWKNKFTIQTKTGHSFEFNLIRP